MNFSNTKHESTIIDQYTKEGFTASYHIEKGKLKDLESGNLFTAEQVTIYDEYRYEGMSDPGDMSILYALHTVDGNKGTLLVPYGPTADTELALFMKEVTLDMRQRSTEEVNKTLNKD